jgi:hypothetical protein
LQERARDLDRFESTENSTFSASRHPGITLPMIYEVELLRIAR